VFSKFFFAYRVGKEPHKVNAVIRINDEKANETTAAVAQMIEHNPKWKKVFPSVVPDKERGWGANGYFVKRTDVDNWAEICTESPDGPTFVGYGWKSGSIIGSRFNGVVIVDDIHDDQNTRSERTLAQMRSFVNDVLDYCLMKGAWEIWNFTPWTMNDVYAELKSTGLYKHSKTPVMRKAEEGEGSYWELDERIPYSGQWWHLYWPEVWGFDRIGEKYLKTGAIGFARMMMLDLEATKGITLKEEWLHYYPANEVDRSWPVYMGIDYASTQDKIRDKKRDYFALALFRAIPGGGLVLFDGYRGHLSKGEALKKVAALNSAYPYTQLIGVESIGKGEEFYNDLVFVDDAYGVPLPLYEVNYHRGSKGQRFEEWLAPRFQSGRIWVSNAQTQFLREFINEWLLWPNGEHDDCLDAVYMGALAGEGALPSTQRRTHGRTQKPSPHPFSKLRR
jgi:phage terminase large subunit-like protein